MSKTQFDQEPEAGLQFRHHFFIWFRCWHCCWTLWAKRHFSFTELITQTWKKCKGSAKKIRSGKARGGGTWSSSCIAWDRQDRINLGRQFTHPYLQALFFSEWRTLVQSPLHLTISNMTWELDKGSLINMTTCAVKTKSTFKIQAHKLAQLPGLSSRAWDSYGNAYGWTW